MNLISNQTEGAICTLQLNRPDKLNALNREMYALLTSGIEDATNNDAVKTIIIKGTPGIFTAGNDLADFAASIKDGGTFDAPFPLMHAMLDCNKPVIASVDGPAIGIGATMLFHCDLIYASPGARFHTPFTDLGVCPEFASSETFPAVLGSHKAAQMLLLGDPLSAEDAVTYGLVNQLIESEELDSTVNAVAEKLVAKPDDSLRTSHALMKARTQHYREIVDREAKEFARLMGSEEFKQKLDNFLSKSK